MSKLFCPRGPFLGLCYSILKNNWSDVLLCIHNNNVNLPVKMIHMNVISSIFNRIVQMGSSPGFIGCIGIFTAVESNELWNYSVNLFCFGISVNVMKTCIVHASKYYRGIAISLLLLPLGFCKTFSRVNIIWGFSFKLILDYNTIYM